MEAMEFRRTSISSSRKIRRGLSGFFSIWSGGICRRVAATREGMDSRLLSVCDDQFKDPPSRTRISGNKAPPSNPPLREAVVERPNTGMVGIGHDESDAGLVKI